MFYKKSCFIILTISLFFCGCQNTSPLKKTSELQQQTINEMQARLNKTEIQLEQYQQDMSALKKEFAKLKEDVKKVQPKYVEGNIQEGAN